MLQKYNFDTVHANFLYYNLRNEVRLERRFYNVKKQNKKSIGILTMACFLATPISYVISANTTEAAPPP